MKSVKEAMKATLKFKPPHMMSIIRFIDGNLTTEILYRKVRYESPHVYLIRHAWIKRQGAFVRGAFVMSFVQFFHCL